MVPDNQLRTFGIWLPSLPASSYDVCGFIGLMGGWGVMADSGDFDQDQVTRGLREAAGFYARKVDELNLRRQELVRELAVVEQ
ncbi:hypothetical protein [Kitasatospora sp. GP82]|uniref:hypothetical protein n=1 Tax=Kitasatospora sp. GP82 TaxID=3035089 RepID=UPI002473A0C6|nr:hypothetical protein [Kitasatospora sp. GP82]MDH6130625.1 hypothetical protein [Kitasatospora sp. GP82]